MVYIIKGKRYNTKTAAVIDTDSHGAYGDFSRYKETLYRTRKGAFFIEGTGGPMSRWAEREGDGWTSGSGARVIDTAEAIAWCERAGTAPAVMAEFFQLADA